MDIISLSLNIPCLESVEKKERGGKGERDRGWGEGGAAERVLRVATKKSDPLKAAKRDTRRGHWRGRWRRVADDRPANMLAITEMLQALVVVVVVVDSKDSRMVVATKRSFLVAIDGLDCRMRVSFRWED